MESSVVVSCNSDCSGPSKACLNVSLVVMPALTRAIEFFEREEASEKERERVKKLAIDEAWDTMPPIGPMVIWVASLTGKHVLLHVSVSMTIFQVKVLYEAKEGVPPCQMRLVFKGRQLEDDRRLWDYNINKDDTITMILRLRGGMYHATSGRNGLESSNCITVNVRPSEKASDSDDQEYNARSIWVSEDDTVQKLLEVILLAYQPERRPRNIPGLFYLSRKVCDRVLVLGESPLQCGDPSKETLKSLGFTDRCTLLLAQQ